MRTFLNDEIVCDPDDDDRAKTPEMVEGRGTATRRLRAGTLGLLFGSDQARFHFALKELPYEAEVRI